MSVIKYHNKYISIPNPVSEIFVSLCAANESPVHPVTRISLKKTIGDCFLYETYVVYKTNIVGEKTVYE